MTDSDDLLGGGVDLLGEAGVASPVDTMPVGGSVTDDQMAGLLAASETPADAPAPAVHKSSPEPAGVPNADIRLEIKKFFMQALLEKAYSAVPSKDILPVLKNFQIEARPGRLRVVATDLELSVVSTIEMVSVSQPGTAVFPAKKLLEIMREAEDEELHLTVVDGVADLAVGPTTWRLRLQDGSDYPALPEIADIQFHEVDRVKFLGGLRSVRYAAATDTVRPNLMMIDITDGKMTACDGVRFQQAQLGDDFPLSLQIPIGAVDDLFKLLNTTDLAEVGIGEADYHIVFRIGNDVFIANKLMATFPDVERMLLEPALRNTHELLCDRSELEQAIKRVRINADPETSAVVLRLGTDTVSVESQDKLGNASREQIDASWKGQPRILVINHKFLMDMLAMYDGKSCKFRLGDDSKSRKSTVMLQDDETGTIGIIQQMKADYVTEITE